MIRARSGNFVPGTRSSGRRFDGWEAKKGLFETVGPLSAGIAF